MIICQLRDVKVDCHLAGKFLGAYGYADDVTLLAPTHLGPKVKKNDYTFQDLGHLIKFQRLN